MLKDPIVMIIFFPALQFCLETCEEADKQTSKEYNMKSTLFAEFWTKMSFEKIRARGRRIWKKGA